MEIKQFLEQEIETLIKLEPNKFGNMLTELKPEIMALSEKVMQHEIHQSIRPRIMETFVGVLHRLFNWSIIAPITGEEDEWELVKTKTKKEPKLYRNKRMPSIIKTETGACFFEEAIIFVDVADKTNFRAEIEGVTSIMGIKAFPFIPRTFVVDVIPMPYNIEKNGEKPNMVIKDGKHFIYHIKNKKQVALANKYYNK